VTLILCLQSENKAVLESLLNIPLDHLDVLYIWGIVGSFIFSCYFASVETALTSLSRVQVERLSAHEGFFKRSVRSWKDHPNRILATILVADTLADTATATLTASFMIKNYPNVHILIVTTALTVVVLLFGEIIPKMIGRAFAEEVAPILCRTLLIFDYIFYPITYLITNSLLAIFKVIGIALPNARSIKSGDIESMILLASREGSVERDKTTILSSVFQFSKRRVKDIMIPRDKICALAINSTLSQVLDLVRQENHSRYPVYNTSLDRIIGFLHARDLFGIIRQSGALDDPTKTLAHFSLRTCLRRAFFVSESMMISRVLHDMKSNRIHLAIVKDEWGNVVGLITLEDILEEVFGEIEDEHDEASTKPVVDLYSAGVEVEGSETLVDLQSKYGVEVEPGESYSTVNGFLQHYSGHQQLTPKMIIIWNKYVFSILSVRDGEIEKVRITEIPSDDDEES